MITKYNLQGEHLNAHVSGGNPLHHAKTGGEGSGYAFVLFDENHAHTRCIISFRLDHCPKLEAQCFEIPVFIDIGQEKQHTL
jgi:hypothetical protein